MDKLDRFFIVKGNIVRMNTQAVVNAANTSLLGGGGVDGAIHRSAGLDLLRECETLGGCKTGEAKITGGYKLKAEYVIHTPGPVWRGGTQGEAELLACCYQSCLRLAVENEITSLAFPLISTGVYGYPMAQAARIGVKEIVDFLNVHKELVQVYLVCYSDAAFSSATQALGEYAK